MLHFIFLFLSHCLIATLPVDISFLVADVKYNEEQGAKICEVQQGMISKFKGYDDLHGGKGVIGEHFAQLLSSYHSEFWVLKGDVNYFPMWTQLVKNGWKSERTKKRLLKNPDFISLASKPPQDPHNISSYSAILLARGRNFRGIDAFHVKYPGVVIIDSASEGYWFDKYKMCTLFEGDEVVESVKPKWGLYHKKYSDELVKRIYSEIPANRYVIKPRNASQGKGVLIVDKKDLDLTLKNILLNQRDLLKHPDPAYHFWGEKVCKFDSFLVEEYIPSDPVYFEGKPYNGTIRLLFALVYNQNEAHLHYFGGYWIIPKKSLEDQGSLNEKNKAKVNDLIACEVDPKILEAVKGQLTEPLLSMYERMLSKKEI